MGVTICALWISGRPSHRKIIDWPKYVFVVKKCKARRTTQTLAPGHGTNTIVFQNTALSGVCTDVASRHKL